MNKIAIIALAFVACAVAVASANKVGKHHRSHSGEFDDEEEFGGLREHQGRDDFDEIEGHRRGFGHGHGVQHHLRNNRIEGDRFGHRFGDRFNGHQVGHGGQRFRNNRRRSQVGESVGSNRIRGNKLRRRGGAALGGVGGVAGAGAAGHLRREDSVNGLAGSHNHVGSHNLAEGHQGSAIAGSNHFDAAAHRGDSNENEGSHKHKVIDADQTIIKNRVKGVEDADTFRNKNEHHEGGHISGGASGFAGQTSGGKLASSKEADHDSIVAGGAHHSEEAEGAAGILGAAGAGVGGAGSV